MTRTLLLAWLGLLVLLAVEIGASQLTLGWVGPPAVLLLAGVMLLTVVFAFMRLGSSPALSRAFAVAAVLWVAILMGLTSVDRFTRADYPVPVTRHP